MNKRKTCFVAMRLQQDWNKFYNERFCLDGFSVKIDTPVPIAKHYSVTVWISASAATYNDKPYQFTLLFWEKYPYVPPLVQCNNPIYHPNIEAGTGLVKLSIFNQDWLPVLTLNSIVLALQSILVSPVLDQVPSNPYNLECLRIYLEDKSLFLERMKAMMQCEGVIPPCQLEANQTEKESLDTVMGRRKRELREEEKLVHKLCKKFAALCDDTLGKTECLDIENADEEGDSLKFTKPSSMETCADYSY
eukprot:TRINITY_DN1621_c0_g1_i8.p1 TRINITY_DN1621_c0_g1~~TRINITY_DN1621_c0_g1_i8.p1  ORF type:complete len:248 (-),score=33.24 TRINITY_DN1621_c0_g1_i8:224-967(-)